CFRELRFDLEPRVRRAFWSLPRRILATLHCRSDETNGLKRVRIHSANLVHLLCDATVRKQRRLSQFECCDAEDLSVREPRDWTEHHPGAAEDFAHPITRGQRQRISVDLRNVEKNWLARHARTTSYQHRLCHVSVCSEQRADLVAGPAGPHHRVAANLAAIDRGERMTSRPVYPILQESAAWRGKVSLIVSIDALERKSAHLDDALWLRKINATSLE